MKELIKEITSADGTKIGYRQIGKGEGLIICHGGGRISQNYRKLAEALADTYTVYTPDRRGRGLSEKEGDDYGIGKACEDLHAVIKETEASFIFGHSAGAMIALETVLRHPVKKLAVYDPPISTHHSLPSGWLMEFEKALKQKQFKKAMAISLKGLKAHEGMEKMPLWMLLIFINVLALNEGKKEKGTRFLDLIPTLSADMKMAVGLDSTAEKYKNILIPVFLMAGSKSQLYFREGIHHLQKIIPVSTTTFFENCDHYSPEEKTVELSFALKQFYK